MQQVSGPVGGAAPLRAALLGPRTAAPVPAAASAVLLGGGLEAPELTR
jgi:hypothetical protein